MVLEALEPLEERWGHELTALAEAVREAGRAVRADPAGPIASGVRHLRVLRGDHS